MEKTVINNRSKSVLAYVKEFKNSWHLVTSYAIRDMKLKYAQTILGILWTIIQPVAFLLIFTVLFDKILHVDTGNVSYPVFAFTGIFCWTIFSSLMIQGGMGLIQNREILQKVYFPRLVIPASRMLLIGAESLITLVILFAFLIWFNVSPNWKWLLIPLLMILNLFVGFLAAVWVSLATFKYRDLVHALPFFLSIFVWLTPIYYPVSILPEKYSWLLSLNPLTVLAGLWRWVILDLPFPDPLSIVSGTCWFILGLTGIYFFIRSERRFADFL